MAKVLKYYHCIKLNNGTEEKPVFVDLLSPVTMGWNEVNEEIAKKEAYNREYTIVDEGRAEPMAEPTTDDVLNALLGVK